MGICLLDPHALHISIKASFSKSWSFQGKCRHLKQIMVLFWVSKKAEEYSLCICLLSNLSPKGSLWWELLHRQECISSWYSSCSRPCPAKLTGGHLVPPAKAHYTMQNPGEEGIVCRWIHHWACTKQLSVMNSTAHQHWLSISSTGCTTLLLTA